MLDTRSSTWVGLLDCAFVDTEVVLVVSGTLLTLEIAPSSVGLGAELLEPNRRFIVRGEMGTRGTRVGAARWETMRF